MMYGIHLAYKQSIMLCIMSILFLMEKLMKLVSTRTWKGGPSWVLYWKKRALDCCTCSVVLISFGSSAFFFLGGALSFSLSRGSEAEIILFIVANRFVCRARPITTGVNLL